ncbi:MAG: serine/threonine-protein kinase, partial [Gammaproteobacteria bacterium]
KLYESREAEIHLAFSHSLGMSVVLKVASRHTNSEVELARFKREFETIQRMREPSVAYAYDYGETDDFAYMALEHFPAGSLKDRLRGPLGRQQAVEYLRRIALALRPVHKLNIVHRDLKPSNIMLRSDDTIALIDFGIVKEIGEGAGLTMHGELRGSPYYMSPEQASGMDIDCRSDIYSLGVVFYEMLTGQKPYVGTDLMQVLNQHIDAPPPMLPGSLSGYQPLIDYLMAKDREERIATVDEVLIDAVLQDPENPNPYQQSQRA